VIDHDALFKSLLRTGRVLRDFFRAFLPTIGAAIDFERVEFLDKERFTSDGRRRTGDLLIKTRFRGEAAAFLIHLEHEAQARRDFAKRMLEYLALDWRDFGLPVYPIAVLSHPEFNPKPRAAEVGAVGPTRPTPAGSASPVQHAPATAMAVWTGETSAN